MAAGYAMNTEGYNIFKSILKGLNERVTTESRKHLASEIFHEMVTAFREAIKVFPRQTKEAAVEAIAFWFEEEAAKVILQEPVKVLEQQEHVIMGGNIVIPDDIPDDVRSTLPPALLLDLGVRDHIRNHVRIDPKWYEGDLVETARRFIQMEIDAHPESVGPPIDILVLTPGGAEWKQRKDDCRQDLEP